MPARVPAALATLVTALLGCGGTAATPDAGSRSDAPAADDVPSSTCATDPLRTGLTAVQTGVSVDAFDCEILHWTAAAGEPDPMIIKSIIYVESRFDRSAVACPNHPCGIPMGWTADESGCFGLMQIVPACGGDGNRPALLANGHPDLETDPSASGWASSVFNPTVNVQIGVAGIAGNRAQVRAMFPGCTEEQYTLMAIGNYNSYGSTHSCTDYNRDYDTLVLAAYDQYAAAAHYPARTYPR